MLTLFISFILFITCSPVVPERSVISDKDVSDTITWISIEDVNLIIEKNSKKKNRKTPSGL